MITKGINFIKKLKKPIRNFIKSSFLSLLVLALILLILTGMDQAYTMMVLMLEEDKVSLLMSFVYVNALALVLSHYPIYTYYSKGLNKSLKKNAIIWKVKKFHLFKAKKAKLFYPFFIFEKEPNITYTISVTANVLRYSLGVFIYAVWTVFVVKTFERNLIFHDDLYIPLIALKAIIISCFFIPIILYSYLKFNLTYNKFKDSKLVYRRLTISFFIATSLAFGLLTYLCFGGNMFSRKGFILMLFCTYAMMFCYIFFRLTRSKLQIVLQSFAKKNTFRGFIRLILPLRSSLNYLKLFIFFFIVSVGFIIYWNIAVIKGLELKLNVIPIMLIYLYAYYWIIANIGKYFYAAGITLTSKKKKKEKLYSNSGGYKISFIAIVVLLALVLKSFFSEQYIHEIEKVSRVEHMSEIVNEDVFIDKMKKLPGDHVFFISSYGGGLKANAWTLSLLQKMQQITNNRLLAKTISFSGASGGSLGLALYTGLYANANKVADTTEMKSKIKEISLGNYASGDLAFALGYDFYRKLWPLSYFCKNHQDRSYYSMIKYQNLIAPGEGSVLDDTQYRKYWAKAFNKEAPSGFFPSLIMNTAGIRANRGVLWSVKDNGKFNKIFPSADNLADLYKDGVKGKETLPFYQAVSMTNRFPGLSPAAKIKGYGHYMDAGVIDNSGLLGNLDLYNYLRVKEKDSLFYNKKVVFIDIINSKELYVDYILKDLIKQHKIDVYSKDEEEKDNVIVNLQTALNYNKIPKYLGSFFENWGNKYEGQVDLMQGKVIYRPLYLPHKITVEDIESRILGELKDQKGLEKLLETYNEEILKITGTHSVDFSSPWEFYEPTLSRHMSESSYRYMNEMLDNHIHFKERFSEIRQFVASEKKSDTIALRSQK